MSEPTSARSVSRRVLAIVDGASWYEKLLPLLHRSACEVRRVADGASAQLMVSNAGFDLVIAEYPIDGLSVVDLLTALRAPGGPSARGSVLVIAPAEQVPTLSEHLTRQEVEVRADTTPADTLIRAASRLLGVATRTDDRSLVHLEADVEGGRVNRLCQVLNLSETGMLLRSSRLVPVGTELNVSFHLPEDPCRIEAQVRVVRHTEEERESLPGMGVRFVRFQPGSDQRLQSYLEDRVRQEEAPPASDRPAASAESST